MRRKKRKASQNVKRGREIKEDKSEEKVIIVEEQEEIGKGKQVTAGETTFNLPNKTTKTEIEYQGLTIQELEQYAMLVLEDLETARMKSPKVQGRISGIMKDRIQGMKGIIECLIEKVQERDVIYHKTKNMELSTEIKRLKKEKEMWEREKEMKNQEIEAKQTK